MSLRDQLLAKGLASKKDARRVNRDLKKKRKQEQSKRDRKSHLESEEALATEARRSSSAEEKQLRRKGREMESAEIEERQRVKQIIDGNSIRHEGRTVFHFKKVDRKRLGRLEVSEKVAWMLRCGEAGIAGYEDATGETYTVIAAKAAHRLLSIAPTNLVFFTTDTDGISDAEEAFLVRTWEMSLRPQRKH